MTELEIRRGPGRPPLAAKQQPARENRIEDVKEERKSRRVSGSRSRLKLSIPPHLENDPNWRYYWAADRAGRLEQLTKHDDYDFVTDDETAADGRQTGAGTCIERHAGTDEHGKPVRHFLLRKPMHFHKQHQLEKRQERAMTMAAIKRGKTPAKEGGTIHEDGSYVPDRGITIEHGDYKP